MSSITAAIFGYALRKYLRLEHPAHWFLILPVVAIGAATWTFRGPVASFDLAVVILLVLFLATAFGFAASIWRVSKRTRGAIGWSLKDWSVPLAMLFAFGMSMLFYSARP
jgi:hypothetical protein